jgi:hypothetical protein
MPRPLADLLKTDDPAWPLVQQWIAEARNPVEVLPVTQKAADAELEALQVTVRSPMGAIAYHTGGLLVDHGWVRILGSGHARLSRTITGWNRGRSTDASGQSRGFLLVADDVLGGFFAINGGGLGEDVKNVYYFAPDSLRWESLGRGYSDCVLFVLNGDLEKFYPYRWKTWRQDVQSLGGDSGFSWAPPLFTKEGQADVEGAHREPAPIDELYRLNVEHWPSQLGP